MAIGALSDAALSECRRGETESGEFHARQALTEAEGSGVNPGIRGGVKYTVVSCILANWEKGVPPARLAEAGKLLKQIGISAVAAITGDTGWGGNVLLSLAIIAMERRQFQQAAELLKQAQRRFLEKGADLYQKSQCQTLAKSSVASRDALNMTVSQSVSPAPTAG